jgi:hypothetical protein
MKFPLFSPLMIFHDFSDFLTRGGVMDKIQDAFDFRTCIFWFTELSQEWLYPKTEKMIAFSTFDVPPSPQQ